MIDREKVIKGLKCAIGIRGVKNCDDCPYDNDFNCIGCDIVMWDALELLKDEPEQKHTQWVHEPDRTNHWHCSGCGYVTGLAGLMGNFCPNCGAKVQKKTEAELRAEVSGG